MLGKTRVLSIFPQITIKVVINRETIEADKQFTLPDNKSITNALLSN